MYVKLGKPRQGTIEDVSVISTRQHDAPRSHTLREEQSRMMCPNSIQSPNVAQTVRSLGNKLVPSDEMSDDAQRGMVDLNVFFLPECAQPDMSDSFSNL